ncbi:MAG: hypothetical protein Q9195_006105 [Heterodermia aff. obscurata]
MGGVDVISINLTLTSLALLALKDPRGDFKRVHVRKVPPTSDVTEGNDGDEAKIWEEPYPPSLRRRIPWVLTLVISIRYPNWHIGDPTHDKRQPAFSNASRRRFAISALRHIITGYLLLDLTSSYTRIDPYFHDPDISISSAIPSFSTLPLLTLIPPRILRTTILAAQIYALIPCLFHLPVLPAIALNYLAPSLLPDEWSPHTWPPFFGPFSAVSRHGLRGLWGEWWHQMSRNIVSPPGRALANVLHLDPRSTLRYMLVTVSAFSFSGVVHMGLVPPQPLHTTMTLMEMRLRIASFFWVQIAGFAIELVVSGIFRRAGGRVSGLVRVVVLVWVSMWLCATLPLVVPPFRELRYWSVYPIPVSVFQGILGRGWLQWA